MASSFSSRSDMMMRISLASLSYQPSPEASFSLMTTPELFFPPTWSSSSSRHRLPLIICGVPARDVVIDFGKFKGSKMGTLPSSYLRWLTREVGQTRFGAWAEYAEEVLKDPYYRDRMEWESIEKLAIRGDRRKGGPPMGDAGVKGSMQALGWNLADRDGWTKVNFSLLGTSLGGIIPRKKVETSDPNNNLASSPRLASRKPRIEARTVSPDPNPNSSPNILDSRNPGIKASVMSPGPLKKDPPSPALQPQQSESLSLQEELLRRRRLRKERALLKSSSKLPPSTENVTSLFPGRDSLLKKLKRKEDR